MVLAGIDVTRVSAHDLARIVMSLQECLDKLDQLVSGGLDWNSITAGEVIVRRKELRDWLDVLSTVPISVTEWRNGPRHLSTMRATPSQQLHAPIFMVKWRTSLLALLAFALGIAGGVSFVKFHFLGNALTQRDQTTTNDDIASPSDEPKRRPKSAPGSTVPISRPGGVSVDNADVLRKAVQTGKVDALVDILTLLPSNGSIAAEDFHALIEFSTGLVEKSRFDDGVRIVTQLIRLQGAQSLDQSAVARIEDLQRKASEGCESINQQDRRLYESVRESTDEQQVGAARHISNADHGSPCLSLSNAGSSGQKRQLMLRWSV